MACDRANCAANSCLGYGRVRRAPVPTLTSTHSRAYMIDIFDVLISFFPPLLVVVVARIQSGSFAQYDWFMADLLNIMWCVRTRRCDVDAKVSAFRTRALCIDRAPRGIPQLDAIRAAHWVDDVDVKVGHRCDSDRPQMTVSILYTNKTHVRRRELGEHIMSMQWVVIKTDITCSHLRAKAHINSTGTGNTLQNKSGILIDFDRSTAGWLTAASLVVAAELNCTCVRFSVNICFLLTAHLCTRTHAVAVKWVI